MTMYSTVQVVLILDLNNFVGLCNSESDIEHHVAKIKLMVLRQLVGLGARSSTLRWAWKFYDSQAFRPDTSRKHFLDFSKRAFGEFENELTDKYCKAFDSQEEGRAPRTADSQPHSFVLKKALQEVLLDYNWDGPDITSPVKPSRRRNNGSLGAAPCQSLGGHNVVVVFTNVPQEEGGKGRGAKSSSGGFLASVLDGTMAKAFQEDKKISLNFVELREKGTEGPSATKINADLAKFSGSLRCISDFAQTLPRQVAETKRPTIPGGVFGHHSATVAAQEVQLPWKSARPGRPRRPQPGPSLLWEDENGISHLHVELQVLAVYGSWSWVWGSAAVVGAVHTSQVALLTLAQETASLYVCVAAEEVFGALVTVLATHQLSLVLRLSGGSLALLSPWGGGAGCLAPLSASGLAPSTPHLTPCTPGTLQFVSAAVKNCLGGAPPYCKGEVCPSTRWFSASMVQPWFRPLPASALPSHRARSTCAPQRKAMQERLQKRYRPQIPRPLATGEAGPLDLVDITQPPSEHQPAPAPLAKPTMTRAQQLLKKSHIVTAQQKVKEQRAEEEERVQATERRAAQATERARKSQALETQVLNTVSDLQDEQELVQSLIGLREAAGVEADIFTTAQTIINLALVHVKNTITTAAAATTMQDGLRRVLGSGVLQSVTEISRHCSPDTRLHQYKLHALLHLELLWVLGYSSSSKQSEGDGCEEEEEEMRKEHHVEEVVRLLRAISLHHNPTTMAAFLQETVLENYVETLGEVLLEVYEELNQPLPSALQVLANDLGSTGSVQPHSVKSQESPSQSYESPDGSAENLGSGKSKDGHRPAPRPHLTLQEANKRSIVVPKVTRALSRTLSEQPHPRSRPYSADAPTKGRGSRTVKNVRRNLFEPGEVPAKSAGSRLKRCHTHSGQHTTPKKPSALASKVKRPTHITPIKTGKATSLRPKKGGIFIPETPDNKIGCTMFNRNRCLKSAGTIFVGESPELKKLSRTTPRRLQASLTAARRNSFYSGARSRNWERAKTQLLATHIKSHSDRRPPDPGPQQTPANASFLFSDILSACQMESPHQLPTSREQCSSLSFTPERKKLDFSLDNTGEREGGEEEGLQSGHSANNNTRTEVLLDSPAKNTRARLGLERSASLDLRHTPVKKVRRALSLGTPSKLRSPRNMETPSSTATGFSGFSTPTKTSVQSTANRGDLSGVSQSPGVFSVSRHDDPSLTTDSFPVNKRVHFTLKQTPQTPQTPRRTLTPKSILKTPNKTPNKTPLKSPCSSPALFGSTLKSSHRSDAAPGTPCRGIGVEGEILPHTPPMKMRKRLVSFGDSEFELLSPTKVTKGEYLQTCESSQKVCSLLELKGKSLKKLCNIPTKLVGSPQKLKNSPMRLVESPAKFSGSPRNLAEQLEELEFDAEPSDGVTNPLEVDVSTLPHLSQEDIDLMSSLLFDNIADPDSGVATLELNEQDDLQEPQAVPDESVVANSYTLDQSPLPDHMLPDLEATIAHCATLEEECPSPELLPNIKEWRSRREDRGRAEQLACGPGEEAAVEHVNNKAISEGGSYDSVQDVDAEDNGCVQDVAEESGSLQDDSEDTNFVDITGVSGSSLDCSEGSDGSLHNVVGDTVSSHNMTEETGFSHDTGEDVDYMHDVAGGTVHSHLVAEDTVSSHLVAGDTVSSHNTDEDCSVNDVAEDTVSSHVVAGDTVSSHNTDEDSFVNDVAEDIVSSHLVAEDSVSSHDTGEDSYANDIAKDTMSSHDSDEDSSQNDIAESTASSHDASEVSFVNQVTINIVSSRNALKDDSLHNITGDASSHPVTEDALASCHMVQDTGVSNQVAADAASSLLVDKDIASPLHMTGDNLSSQDASEDSDSECDVVGDIVSSHRIAQNTVSSHQVAEDTVLPQASEEDGSLYKEAENTGSSKNVREVNGSLCYMAEDTNSSHDMAEDNSLSHDVAEDNSLSHDVAEDNSLSHDVAEDNSLSHDIAEDTSLSHDVAEDTSLSHDMAEDTSLSHDVAEDTSLSHDVAEDTSLSHGVAEDTGSSHHVAQDSVSSYASEGDGSSHTSKGNDLVYSEAEDSGPSHHADKEDGSLCHGAKDIGTSQHDSEKDDSVHNVAEDIFTLHSDKKADNSLCSVADDTKSSGLANKSNGSTHCIAVSSSMSTSNDLVRYVTQENCFSHHGSEDENYGVRSMPEGAGLMADSAEKVGFAGNAGESSGGHDVLEDTDTMDDVAGDVSVCESGSVFHIDEEASGHLASTISKGCSSASLGAKVDAEKGVTISEPEPTAAHQEPEEARPASATQAQEQRVSETLQATNREGLQMSSAKPCEDIKTGICAAGKFKTTEKCRRRKRKMSNSSDGETDAVVNQKSSTRPCNKDSKGGLSTVGKFKTAEKCHRRKRKMNISSEDEPDVVVNQENKNAMERRRVSMKLRERREAVTVTEQRRRVQRECRKLVRSMCELSSDEGEDWEWQHPQHQTKKRIFDSDVDFPTPEKNNAVEVALPLKNVENLPNTPDKPGLTGTALGDTKISQAKSTPDTAGPAGAHEKCKQDRESCEAGMGAPEEWRQQPCSPPIPKGNHSKEAKGPGRGKGKRKGVKLKLTWSGDQYQVTETNISRGSSDPNSSGDLDLYLGCSDLNDPESSRASIPTPTSETSRKKSEFVLTPHRFTRHMSRDLSVSPELYHKLITLSPRKNTNLPKKPKTESGKGKGEHLGHPLCTSTPGGSKRPAEEWWVRNVSGSPTMKAFIRKEKEKHPRVATHRNGLTQSHQNNQSDFQGGENEKRLMEEENGVATEAWSPIFQKRKTARYSNPSIKSLLHLSSDKILLHQDSEEPGSPQEASPRSLGIKRQQNLKHTGPPAMASNACSPGAGRLRSSRRLYSSLAD